MTRNAPRHSRPLTTEEHAAQLAVWAKYGLAYPNRKGTHRAGSK